MMILEFRRFEECGASCLLFLARSFGLIERHERRKRRTATFRAIRLRKRPDSLREHLRGGIAHLGRLNEQRNARGRNRLRARKLSYGVRNELRVLRSKREDPLKRLVKLD